MGVKIEIDGQKFKTKIATLKVNTQYVVHLNGYRVFINVTLERPDVCGQLTTFKKVIGGGTGSGKSKKSTGKTGGSSSPSGSGQRGKESSRSSE